MLFSKYINESQNTYHKIIKAIVKNIEKVNKPEGMKISDIKIEQIGDEYKVTYDASFNPESKWSDKEWMRKFFFYHYNNYEEFLEKCIDMLNLDHKPEIVGLSRGYVAGGKGLQRYSIRFKF